MEHFGNEFTLIFYLIDAAHSGKCMIRVLSEDTAVFILLIWWVYREDMECKVQMERWEMSVLSQRVCSSMAYTPSAIATWPHKAKIKAQTILFTDDFPGQCTGEWLRRRLTRWRLYFIALHDQPPGTSMESASFTLFIKVPKAKPCVK